jgi:hypothetical protein
LTYPCVANEVLFIVLNVTLVNPNHALVIVGEQLVQPELVAKLPVRAGDKKLPVLELYS